MKASIFLGFSLPYQLYLGWIFLALGTGLRIAAAEPISLPIEVMGPNGSSKEIRLEIPEGTSCSSCYLFLRFHGLNYNGQASLQWGDDSPWIPLDETNPAFQVRGLAKAYGGLGGGFASIPATLALGNIGPGSYVLRFRFNRTDGVSSGYRLLEINFLSNGEKLIGEQAFVQDNPDLWEPPFPDEDSIRRGRELWYSANLKVPIRGAIKAHCSDCHAHDGRDLKYFNYSNFAIRSRAVFHGLSAPEGDQIASYIRSLPIEAPGRPWNPPYQPGPGLDSKPVTHWAAGAGLQWALEDDRETLAHIFPDGIRQGVAAPHLNTSAREIPVAFQLPDWNHWLPQIHPMDAYPNFENSDGMEHYLRLRSWLSPGSASAYVGSRDVFLHWGNRVGDFVRTFPLKSGTTEWSELDVRERYSVRQWQLTKMWELQQEFRLEDLSRSWFGPQADPRAWNNAAAFSTSPHMTGIPRGAAGLRNGLVVTNQFLSFAWYHLQLILNNSNKLQEGTSPIDWPYVYGFIKDMGFSAPQAGVLTLWHIKSGQIYAGGNGPGQYAGWSWSVNSINALFHRDVRGTYRGLSAGERNRLLEVQVLHWLETVKKFPPQAFYEANFTSPREPISQINLFDGSWASRTLWSLREMKSFGLDAEVIRLFAEWAATVWPTSANWLAEAH